MAVAAMVEPPDLYTLVAGYERQLIVAALAETEGCQARAAVLLGVRKTTLNEKIKRLGIRADFLPAAGELPPRLVPLREAEFRWRGTLAAGALLDVRGVSGAVWARRASGPEATVLATKGAAPGTPVALSVFESARGVAFSVVRAPSPRASDGGGHLAHGMRDLRVEFRVGVPAGVGLAVRLLAGDVEVLGVDGQVEARTTNGRVSVLR